MELYRLCNNCIQFESLTKTCTCYIQYRPSYIQTSRCRIKFRLSGLWGPCLPTIHNVFIKTTCQLKDNRKRDFACPRKILSDELHSHSFPLRELLEPPSTLSMTLLKQRPLKCLSFLRHRLLLCYLVFFKL